jgi:hypothetical protein
LEALKGKCHEIFDPRFFSSNNTPWAPDSRAKAFLNSASNSPRYNRFSNAKIVHAVSMNPHASCMQCHWPRMHHACSVNDLTYTVHAVSLKPHAFFIFCIASPFCIWFSLLEVDLKLYGACGGNDNTCTCAMYIRCQWHCMHRSCGVNDTACILKNSNIFANSNLYSKRLPRERKSEGRKSLDTVPLRILGFHIWLSFFVGWKKLSKIIDHMVAALILKEVITAY